MPAKSKNQQIMMAIAEHHPGKLYAKNRGVLKMTKKQLHEFASTKRKKLPRRKKGNITEGLKKHLKKRGR